MAVRSIQGWTRCSVCDRLGSISALEGLFAHLLELNVQEVLAQEVLSEEVQLEEVL